jgi:hypothetical protein
VAEGDGLLNRWRRAEDVESDMREGGFCAILIQTARKSLILSGEMSEWLKEHAWKAKRATDAEPLRHASTHTRSAT